MMQSRSTRVESHISQLSFGQVSFRLQQLKEHMVDLGFQLFAQLAARFSRQRAHRTALRFLVALQVVSAGI